MTIKVLPSPSPYLSHSVIRFIAVGVAVAILDLGSFLVLIHLGVATGWANTVGMTIGFISGLWGHHAITFKVPERLNWRVAVRYCISFGLNLALGSATLMLLLWCGLSAAIAKFMTIVLVAASNFVMSRYFVFIGSVARVKN